MTDDLLPPQWHEDRVDRRAFFPVAWRNTASNIAYPITGLVGLALVPRATGFAFALAMLLLGLGSIAYHGTARPWGQQLDRAGMFMAFGALAIHGMAPDGDWRIALLMLVLGVFCSWAFVYRTYANLDRAMGMLLALCLVGAVLLGSWSLGLVSLAVFAVAYVAWTEDHKSTTPWTGLWGHAVWHLLTAVAMLLLFLAQVRRP
jgi:hypothetical protein